jgi:enoyl-CoA hydratase/carnithine racemase
MASQEITTKTITTQILPSKVGLITLNRPEKRNALSIAMRREISACLAAWKDDPAVGAVVVTGSGSGFCAGFDLDEFRQPDLFPQILESSSQYHRDLWYFPKPLIAAVNGTAVGGGFDLAVFCDIRLCDIEASFGHPEIKFGAPPLWTPLRWIIGDGRARELCLTGRRMQAAEALQAGLVSEVVQPGEVVARAVQVAEGILEAPMKSVLAAKSFFLKGREEFERAFAVEHDEAFREVLFPALEGFR